MLRNFIHDSTVKGLRYFFVRRGFTRASARSLLNSTLNRVEYRLGRGRMLSNPDFLQIEPTTACNLKCRMCGLQTSWSDLRKKSLYMTRETFLKAVPFLSTARLAILQGWGESLLHPDILWMVETCKREGAMVGILTNGTLLDAKLSATLVELQAEFLAVSLDAATQQTYREVRGGDFDAVIANVARLAEEKKKRNSRYPILQFSFCVMKKNLHEIAKLVDLAEKYGVDEIVLNNLIVYSPDMQEQSVYDIPEEVTAVHREVKAKAESKGILLFYNGVNRIEHEPDCPFRNFAVLADGSVGPCGAQRVVLGNIVDSPLRELWNGEAYRAMRRRYVNGEPPHACERCPNYTNAGEDHVDPDMSYVEETLGRRRWEQAATRSECAKPRRELLDIGGPGTAG